MQAVKSPVLRVLVIDDDFDNAESMALLIRTQGYDARAASDQDFLQIIRSFLPSLVLLDLAMPHQSGVDVAQRIRGEELVCQPEIIVVSGLQGEAIRDGAKEAGAARYFVKPVDPDKLVTILREKQDDIRHEEQLLGEADEFFFNMDREFTDYEILRLQMIREAYAKNRFFAGSSIIARFVMDLPEVIDRDSLRRHRLKKRLYSMPKTPIRRRGSVARE